MTEAGPPRASSGALSSVFISHTGLGNCLLVFLQSLKNTPHVLLCSVLSTFPCTWLCNHSPVLGLFAVIIYMHTHSAFDSPFTLHPQGSVFSRGAGFW